jgi:hypothetical protein
MRYEPLTLHDPIFEPEDSRVWWNECWNPGSTARLSDVLDEMKVNYIDLYLIGHPTRYGPVLTTKSPNEKYQAQYQVRQLCPSYVNTIHLPSYRNYAR